MQNSEVCKSCIRKEKEIKEYKDEIEHLKAREFQLIKEKQKDRERYLSLQKDNDEQYIFQENNCSNDRRYQPYDRNYRRNNSYVSIVGNCKQHDNFKYNRYQHNHNHCNYSC